MIVDFKKLESISILYVEDNQTDRDNLREILELYVKEVYVAVDGKEGLESFKKNRPDIVITDISMPIMDGFEMSTKIRRINPLTPIIITSVYSESNFLLKSSDLNIDRYITKPINIEKLNEALFRAALHIFKEKEIKERDALIKDILQMHPYYSLMVDASRIDNIHMDILNFLGYCDEREFMIANQNLEMSINKIDDFKNLLMDIKREKILEKEICLKVNKKGVVDYIIKTFFFERTELFLIAFFEKKRIEDDKDFSRCLKNQNRCRVCSMFINKRKKLEKKSD